MRIDKFIMSLLPNFEKSRLTDDARCTLEELKTTTMPAYEQAEKLFKSFKFQSEEYAHYLDTYKRMTKGSSKNNLIVAINDALENVYGNLVVAQEMIDEVFLDDIEKAGLSYRKANLIQLLEAGAFLSKYARKFLMYVYVLETSKFEDSGIDKIENCLSPAEITWLENNFANFVLLINSLSVKPDATRKLLAEIPEIVITPENAKTVPAQFGEAVDPFKMGFIPVNLNIIYHIRMRVAEWQAKRYHAAKEELRVLQLRKINLEKLMERKPDAKIQNEIEYAESRINALNYEIEKMEQEYA